MGYNILCVFSRFGAWRSLVAHSLGVREVDRSNRFAPTIWKLGAAVISRSPLVYFAARLRNIRRGPLNAPLAIPRGLCHGV